MQEKILSADTALVDIGWRGSIHQMVEQIGAARNFPAPAAYYMGFWGNESFHLDQRNSHGLICDQRRSRSLLEGSAYHNVFLLESICRADHGMVTGFYRDNDTVVRPIQMTDGFAREAELSSEAYKLKVQDGVLAYTKWFVKNVPFCVPNVEGIRKEAQRKLFKLAFFPTSEQQSLGRAFVHSEPTDDHRAPPLILEAGKGLKGWFAGIRSPWKGGYFRANGGLAVAGAYCLAEGVLSYLTLEQKLRLRRWLFGKHAQSA
jgi:hypothetical protein